MVLADPRCMGEGRGVEYVCHPWHIMKRWGIDRRGNVSFDRREIAQSWEAS